MAACLGAVHCHTATFTPELLTQDNKDMKTIDLKRVLKTLTAAMSTKHGRMLSEGILGLDCAVLFQSGSQRLPNHHVKKVPLHRANSCFYTLL